MASYISKNSLLYTGEEKTFLKAGEYIRCGEYLFSPNGCWKLMMNGHHLFTFRHEPDYLVPSWSGKLAKFSPECFAIMQHDGNFCVYEGSGPHNQGAYLWGTNTAGKGKIAVMQWDGNFCIYNQDSPNYKNGCIVWQSGFNTGLVSHYNIEDVEYMYDGMTRNSYPETAFTQTIDNGSDVQQETSITFQVKYVEKHNWEKKDTWGISAKASISGKLPIGAKVGFEISGSFSRETAEGKEVGTESTKTFVIPVKIPPRSKMTVIAAITKDVINLPYIYKGKYILANGTESLLDMTGVFKAVNGSGLDVKYIPTKQVNDTLHAANAVKTIDGVDYLEEANEGVEIISLDKNLIKEIK